MRIAVCVSNNSLEKQTIELIKKLESHYGVEYVNAMGGLYESAKTTYEYDNAKNVVYLGCVLDYAVHEKDIHPLDEQIVLCALDNLDVVYVNTTDMTSDEINSYHQFDEFFAGKVVDVNDVDTFVI
jgi:c-di-AMP phosphodiesterase-like protein